MDNSSPRSFFYLGWLVFVLAVAVSGCGGGDASGTQASYGGEAVPPLPNPKAKDLSWLPQSGGASWTYEVRCGDTVLGARGITLRELQDGTRAIRSSRRMGADRKKTPLEGPIVPLIEKPEGWFLRDSLWIPLQPEFGQTWAIPRDSKFVRHPPAQYRVEDQDDLFLPLYGQSVPAVVIEEEEEICGFRSEDVRREKTWWVKGIGIVKMETNFLPKLWIPRHLRNKVASTHAKYFCRSQTSGEDRLKKDRLRARLGSSALPEDVRATMDKLRKSRIEAVEKALESAPSCGEKLTATLVHWSLKP